MLSFQYTVKEEGGKTLTGNASAIDKEALVAQLQRQGYYVINVILSTELEAHSNAKKDIKKSGKRFTHNKITSEDKLLFARQLATMLESGVNLLRSINIIVDQSESKQMFQVLSQIRDDVEQGLPLSAALLKHPKVFNQKTK